MSKLRFAFTLAEIMIVLTVIGVLTAILLPSAINSTPDENVMKFKKANSTLGTVIRELVTSDKYYTGGDLGIKADGSLVASSTYFCETFADLLTTKSVNCTGNSTGRGAWIDILGETTQKFDDYCKLWNVSEESSYRNPDNLIVTMDGITYYEPDPSVHFGSLWNPTSKEYTGKRLFGGTYKNANGFDRIYKVFCFDVDKTGYNNGEDPFGYGIRADGKILPGPKAQEWINKSIQNKD